MKRIFSLLLILCVFFTAVFPTTAFAAETDTVLGFSDSESAQTDTSLGVSDSENAQADEDAPGEAAPEDTPDILEETPEAPESEPPADIPEENPLDSEPASDHTPGESVSDILPEESDAACSTQAIGITPFSGWEDGGNEFYTKIRLTATDRNGNPIEGIVYGLYRTSDNGLVEYLTTNRYGVAESGDVPVDTDYYLLEYSIPAGLQSNPDPKYINLTEICAPSRVDETVVYDMITGNIRVIKTDEDGNPLFGVGFYVYRSDTWTLVDTIYTDSNGEAYTTTLPYGWYELYEFDVPYGMADGGYSSQMIQYDGETHDLYITNYRAYGSAYVYKTGNDGRKIQGAVFSIYRVGDGDEWIEDITTSSSGYAYSSSLPLGDYYIVEKSVSALYELDTTRHDFSIYYDGQTAYFNLVNNRKEDYGEIKVIKTDDSGNPLSGVVFGVYRSWDGRKLTELTTGADGTAECSLIPDDYYLVELSGKTGYTMTTGQIPFTIDGPGTTVEKTVINEKIRIFGKVKVIKQDEAGNPIPGVRLGVYCHKGNLLEELVTGADGTATSGVLNEGTGYYVLEHEGVPGHLSDTETRHSFDITQNNVIVSVNVTNPRITGGVKIIKDNGDGQPLSGVVFGIYKGGVKLMELTTGADGTATSGTLYYGDDYELRELSTVKGYELIDTLIPFSILEHGVIIEIPVSNPLILGSVTVIKIDAEDIPQVQLSSYSGERSQPQGSPLSGAVFGLYNEQGQKIAELTVDETGRATYGGLPKSGYFLKELVSPEGFILLDEIIPFAINEQGENVEITVPNSKGYGTIKIIKYGENETLPGVVFEVYRAANDEKVAELTTGADGTVIQELPLGRYYLLEKSTVSGYLPLNGSVSFALTDAGATVELAIENQKEPAPEGGAIRLTKTDATDDTKLLPGAVFGIYRADNDEKVAELVTGSDGTTTGPALPELEKGYYLLELAAPTSYKAITDKIPVTVKNGETTEITVKNYPVDPAPEKGTLEIIKKSDSGVRLKGAMFGVYRASDDTKITELTTDSDGRAVYDLPEGDFYLKELKCDGYKLITEKIPFPITAGETKTVTVTNTPKDTGGGSSSDPDGMLKIIKKSEDGERLQGAVFGIYKASNNVKVAEVTTNKNGEATYDLPEGDFYLRELKAPTGFKLDADKIGFSISAGATRTITVTNAPEEPTTGYVRLVKKAESTGAKLPGAVFGIFKASNNEQVGELVTGSDGTAISSALPVNDYYLLELTAPAGFKLKTEKIGFSIKAGETKEITVLNAPKTDDTTTTPGTPVTPGASATGNLYLIKRAESTGASLPGAVFGIYMASNDSKVAEITTGSDGTATYQLSAGDYYLRELKSPAGFKLESAKIPFTVKNDNTVLVEVTNMTDDKATPPNITIPKTGEAPPYGYYALSVLCMSLAGICGVMLYRGRKKRRGTV